MNLEMLRKSPILREMLDEKEQEVEARGRAEGEARGRVEGEARGRVEGEAQGRAKDILRLLNTRSIQLSDEQRERISTCTDLVQLDVWFGAAIVATSATDVFLALAPAAPDTP